jgi:hypothetical protein
MTQNYKTEISKLIAKSLGWMIEGTPIRDGTLSPNEIVELTRRDCARGADGLPVMHSSPIRIAKRK